MGRFKFDFNLAAKEAYQRHTVLQKDAIFAENHSGTIILPPKPNWFFQFFREFGIKNIKSKDTGFGALAIRVMRYGMYVAKSVSINERSLKFNLAMRRFNLFSTNLEKDLMGVIDHEIGHLVVKRSLTLTDTTPDGESRADVYAGLRAIQRFGKNDPDAADTGFSRLSYFLSNPESTTHLTTLAVDRMKLDSQTADFISLTPKQTAKLAAHYAAKYVPTGREIKQLKKDFSVIAKRPSIRADNLSTLRKISNITFAAPVDSLTFYMGARTLNSYMKLYEGSIFRGEDGDQWRRIRPLLQERMRQSIHGKTLRYFADTAADIVDQHDPQPQTAARHASSSPRAAW
jgi:hypothetical protein